MFRIITHSTKRLCAHCYSLEFIPLIYQPATLLESSQPCHSVWKKHSARIAIPNKVCEVCVGVCKFS